VQNRPAPLREFDQIYMKAGDLVTMAIYVARKYADQHVVFIGDGDGIALAVMHLTTKGIVRRGPASVLVLDFDERIVMSIKRFADTNEIEDRISARLYNVCDPLPEDIVGTKDAFYTNPPWGASNGGEAFSLSSNVASKQYILVEWARSSLETITPYSGQRTFSRPRSDEALSSDLSSRR